MHTYDGIVSSVMGDGVLALFGAPVAHEDHAVRAAYAALDMLADVRAPPTERSTSASACTPARSSCGRSRPTSPGTTPRWVRRCTSRMERMAGPGQALLTAHSARLTQGFVETECLGAMPVRGFDEPVEVHRLVRRTGVVAVPSADPAAARGVGRP